MISTSDQAEYRVTWASTYSDAYIFLSLHLISDHAYAERQPPMQTPRCANSLHKSTY